MIKIVIAIILMFFFFYRLGLLVSKLLKEEEQSLSNNLIYGTIFSLAVFEIIAISFSILQAPGRILVIIIAAIFIFLIVLSFLYKRNIKLKYEISDLKKPIVIVLIVIIFSIAITSTYLFISNADDAYYVALALENVNNNVNTNDPSTGLPESLFNTNYTLRLYETYVGVLAKIFDIPPAIFFHIVITFVFIILSFCSYYILIKKLYNKGNNRYLTLGILAIIFVFSGFTPYTIGGYTLRAIWRGKTIFLGVIFPFIYAQILALNELSESEGNSKKNIILLWIASIAAVCLNTTSVYYLPIMFGIYGFYLLLKRNFKSISKLIISMVPIILMFIMFIITAKVSSIAGQIETAEEINFFEVFTQVMGKGYYFIIFIACLIINIFMGNRNAKILFVFFPLIAVIFLLNPFVGPYIAKYVTNYALYWRIFWLLPIELCISYTIVRIYETINKKRIKICFLILCIGTLIITGEFLYTEKNGFKGYENLYKIPQFIIDQTDHILENSEGKVIVMAPPEPLHAVAMRQYTNDIILFWSRDMYMADPLFYEQTQEHKDRYKLYKIYREGSPEYSTAEFNELLEFYKIDWIILKNDDEELLKYIEGTKLKKQIEMDDYILYKI